MESSFTYPENLTKAERYVRFCEDFRLFMDGETDLIAALSNTSAALREAFGFFWVGFYLVKDEQWLTLGPFQGSTACSRIRRGRGVCGTAWDQHRSIVVPDVDAFPGHIACSSLSRSEIVIPIAVPTPDAPVLGVLDIDSDRLSAFDDTDLQGLETVVSILSKLFL
ncbi:MAG: GAF domain-containing protein [Bacteroidaceae bacterium]|nr:GAF domain-containing protein [Bacteroidaceae bacterium]